jgi:hypothetical protein
MKLDPLERASMKTAAEYRAKTAPHLAPACLMRQKKEKRKI